MATQSSLSDAMGDGGGFFVHVADDVDWTVMGTHPLAGRYHSKAAFIAGTFDKLNKVLPQGTLLLDSPICRRRHRRGASLS